MSTPLVPQWDKHADEQNRVISFKASEAISGFVVLQGYLLMEAELTISLHRGGRAPLDVQVRPTRPWRLTQLHNCLHYVTDAVKSATLEPARAFEPTLQALRCALDELLLTNPRTFPNSFPDPRVFHPRLPADVTMEFCLQDSRLQCQVLLLRPASGTKKLRQYGSTLRPGDVCMGQGSKMVEILEVLRVDSDVPKIRDVFDSLSVSFVALSNLRAQYEALLE